MATTQEVQILLKAVDQFSPTVKKLKSSVESINDSFDVVRQGLSDLIGLTNRLEQAFASAGRSAIESFSGLRGAIDASALSSEKAVDSLAPASAALLPAPKTNALPQAVGGNTAPTQPVDVVVSLDRQDVSALGGKEKGSTEAADTAKARPVQVIDQQIVRQQKVDSAGAAGGSPVNPTPSTNAPPVAKVQIVGTQQPASNNTASAPGAQEPSATGHVGVTASHEGLASVKEGLAQIKEGVAAPQEALEKLSNTIRLLGSGFLLLQGVKIFAEMADTAAEVERLGTVVHMVGANAGYMSSEIDAADKKIQSLGITATASRSSLTEFIKSGLQLEGAAKLARAAQDLAVISGENSSDTFRGLTQAIGEQSIMMLRWRGISVSNEEAQQKFAATQGRSVSSLNEWEKKQALLNLTLERSASLSGIYEAAMGDVGKQASSLARYQEEAAESLQMAMMPAYSSVVTELTIFLKNLKTMTEEYNTTSSSAASFGEGVGGVARSIRKGLETIVSYRAEITSLAKAYIAFKAAQMGIEFFKTAKTAVTKGVDNLAGGKSWGGLDKQQVAQGKEAVVAEEAKAKATNAHAAASTNAQVAITGEYTATSRLAGSVNAAALAYERMALARAAALKSPLSAVAGQNQNINKQALPTTPAGSTVTKVPTAVASKQAQTNAAEVTAATARASVPRPPFVPNTVATSLSAIGNQNNQLDYTRYNKAGRLIYDGGEYSGKFATKGTIPNPRPTLTPNVLQVTQPAVPRSPAPTVASGAGTVADGVKTIAPAVTSATSAVGGLGRAFSVVGGLAKGIWGLLGGLPGIILTVVTSWLFFGDGIKTISKGLSATLKVAADIKDTIHGWFTGDEEKKAQLQQNIKARGEAYAKEHGAEAELKTPEAKELQAAAKTKMEADSKKIELEYKQGAVKEKLRSSYNVEDSEKAIAIGTEIAEAKEAAHVATEEFERLLEEYKDKLKPETVKKITSDADKAANKKGKENQERIDQTNLLNARKQTGQDQTLFSSGVPVSMSFGAGLNEARLEVEAYSNGLNGVDASVQRVVRAYQGFLDSAKTVEEVIVAQKEWGILLDDTAERLKVLEQLKAGESSPAADASEKEKARFKAVSQEVSKESRESGVSAPDVIAAKLKKTQALKEGYDNFGDPAAYGKKQEKEVNESDDKAKAYYDTLVSTKEVSSDVALSLKDDLGGQIDFARQHAAQLTKEFENIGATLQGLGKEKSAFEGMQHAIEQVTKQTAYFAAALEKVNKLKQAKFDLETSAVSGAEFKGDKTSSVMASINVLAAKDKYERQLAIIQQQQAKNRATVKVEAVTGLEAAGNASTKTIGDDEKDYVAKAKKFKEANKEAREYDPEKEKLEKARKEEEANIAAGVHPRYVKPITNEAPLVTTQEKPKEVSTAAPSPAAVAAHAPTTPEKAVVDTAFEEKWAKANADHAKGVEADHGKESHVADSHGVESISGAKETEHALQRKLKDTKDRLIREGKQEEVALYEQKQILEQLRKQKKSLLETDSASKKDAVEESVKYQERVVASSERALEKKRQKASVEHMADTKGIKEFSDGDKHELDKIAVGLEKTEEQIKKDEERVAKVKTVKESAADKQAKDVKSVKETESEKLLAVDNIAADARIKVSKEYYDALRSQLNEYISTYRAKVEGLRDVHKGDIELSSTLAKQKQGDIIFGEETSFNPNKANIYKAEAAQGQIKLKAEGAKFEEDTAALDRNEAKQKEIISKGDASPEEKQKMLTQLEAQGVTQRLDLNRNFFGQLNSMREEALAKAKQHSQAAVDFEKQARDTILEGNKSLREMNRTGMSEPDKYEDKKREHAEAMARAEEMRKAGDFSGALSQYKTAQNVATSLQGSDAVDPLSSKRDAMARFSDATQGIASMQIQQGQIEKAGAANQMATVQNVTEAMSKLSSSMQDLTQSAEIKLSPKMDEAAIADLQKQLNGVAEDHTAAIKASLDTSSVKDLYDAVQSALNSHTFTLTIDEANITTGKGNTSKSSTTESVSTPLPGKAEGGFIQGVGTGTSDSIPTLLSHGEFVVKRDATDHYGTGFLNLLNSRALRFADGGIVEGKRKEGIAGWLLHQKYTAEDVENAQTVKKSVAKTQPHEDLLNRSLSSETTRRAQIAQAAAYSDYAEGGEVQHFAEGGVVEGKRKPGIAGWLLHQKYTAEDVENAKYGNKPVAKAPEPTEGLLDRSLSKETTRRAQMDIAANYSLGGLISRFDAGGDSGELLPGQVMYQGKPTWASQVPREPQKKEGFFGSLFGKLDKKEEAPKEGTVLGNRAEIQKVANYADGGNVITEAGKYWADDNERFEKTKPSVLGRVGRALNPLTGFGSAMGTMHDSAGKGDFVGMGIAVAESLPLFGELKYLSTLAKASPKLAKTVLPKVGHATKPILDTLLGGTAGAIAEHAHANEVFADGGEVGLPSGQVMYNGKAVWASQVPKDSNKKEGMLSSLVKRLTTKDTEPKVNDDIGFFGGLLGKNLEKDDRRMANTIAAANYYLGGVVTFDEGGLVKKKKNTIIGQAPEKEEHHVNTVEALSSIQSPSGGLSKSTTETVSNAKVVNTNKGTTPSKPSDGYGVSGSVERKHDLQAKIAAGKTLTNADLAEKQPKEKSALSSASGAFSEVKAGDRWFNKLKSGMRYAEAVDVWNDYQSARKWRDPNYHGETSRISSYDDFRGTATRLAEGGIAQQTGEYWAKDNEEFEKSHPNPVQQLARMLNPITGFGAALGTVHKAAGEGDLLGVGMGALGMMPVLGSAVHGARGAKLTFDLLKSMSHHALKDRTKEMVAENVKHQFHLGLPISAIARRLKDAGSTVAEIKNLPVARSGDSTRIASNPLDFFPPKGSDSKSILLSGDKDEVDFKKGSKYAQYASGGMVGSLLSLFGVGEPLKRDKGGMIPALVSHGEYRVNKDAVAHYGSGLFNAINDMSYSRFADGGLAGAASDMLNAENLPNSGQSMTPSEMIELSVKIGEAKASKVQGSRDSIYNLVHSLRDLQDRAMT